MIASLRGKLRAVFDHAIVIDVSGVGFSVRVPTSVLDQSTSIGQTIEVHTHLIVRENEMTLYGFLSPEERELFVTLLGVTGIGPRTALSVTSFFDPEALRKVVASEDAAALARIPGVGRKTAQRLLLDLRDKIGEVEGVGSSALQQGDVDVISALTALGYSVAEAQTAIRAVPEDVRGLDGRILAALRFLGS